MENIDGGSVKAGESSRTAEIISDDGVVLSSKGFDVAEVKVVVDVSTTDTSTKEVWFITFLLPKEKQ